MLIIQHRINTTQDLSKVPPDRGVELDLREDGSRLVLQHDPCRGGEDFENYLKHYKHAFMVVNIKSEGLEELALPLLRKYAVKDYFFLDLSLPALVRCMRAKQKNIAVRFSEYESFEQCLTFKDKAKWVWVDCFHGVPYGLRDYSHLAKHFKLCIVSPELQGYSTRHIGTFRKALSGYRIDAICTKYPKAWIRLPWESHSEKSHSAG